MAAEKMKYVLPQTTSDRVGVEKDTHTIQMEYAKVG